MKNDLLVLGAGPAGTAISLLMSRRGYTVEIVDATQFPRTKICGEFLNPQAVSWLRENGLLQLVEATSPYPIYGMKITDRHQCSFRGTYSNGHGYAIQRKDFDTLMVDTIRARGVKLNEGFRAESLLMDGNRAAGVVGIDADGARVEKRATVLIGADGRNNLIGRTFQWVKGIPGLRKYAFMTYFDQVDDLESHGEIHLVEDGYIGVAPLKSGLANVALVIDEKVRPAETEDLFSFMVGYLRKTSVIHRIRKLEPMIPVMSAGPLAFTVTQASGHGTLLIGDTCGFIDPFTGEGINYAFLSADLAADLLDRCFQNNTFEDAALKNYDIQRHRMFGTKHRMARLFQTAIHSPRLASFLVNRFSKKQALADRIVSAVGGSIPVDQVWNARFVFDFLR